jgi:hypothetical protein
VFLEQITNKEQRDNLSCNSCDPEACDTFTVGLAGAMATRIDAGEGFERVLPARSSAEVRLRGREPWAWTFSTVGLGILFLCLEVLVQEQGTSFFANRFRSRQDLVDVGGVDRVAGPPVTPSTPSGVLEPSEPSAPSNASPDETTQVWSMLLPDVETDARVFASRGSHASLGFACYSYPIPRADTEPVAITRFEPVTTRSDSVHHITVFGCDERVKEKHDGVTFGEDCAVWAFAHANDDARDRRASAPPCRVIVYAYDKGAGAFTAPEGTAVHVGIGTGITRMLYQVHYLAPAEAVGMRKTAEPTPWIDASGVCFSLAFGRETVERLKPLGILAAMHTRMRLPGNRARVDFEYAIGPFANRLAPDFAAAEADGGVTLVAAHMHGHGMLTRYEFGLLRPIGDSRGEEGDAALERFPVGILEGYAGYGVDQSFHAVPVHRKVPAKIGPETDSARVADLVDPSSVAQLRRGDSMYVRCTFDTRTNENATTSVGYGVGHGEEMCGQLVYYYPFATSVDEVGGMRRPEPREDDVENVRENDLYGMFFGENKRSNTTVRAVSK